MLTDRSLIAFMDVFSLFSGEVFADGSAGRV